LAGLLVATYVDPAVADAASERRGGYAGGLLTFFAVGCPVCNKLVLLALGTTGALTWFEPVQPLLQLAGIALLTYALVRRLRGERTCPVTPPERTHLVQR
jgi:threonine/homoserine/homoserine lactone efflux protein